MIFGLLGREGDKAIVPERYVELDDGGPGATDAHEGGQVAGTGRHEAQHDSHDLRWQPVKQALAQRHRGALLVWLLAGRDDASQSSDVAVPAHVCCTNEE